uniref:Uncharacterized protein n=1 Tax=Populus trichocarpa TaxID=3694 RepID=A0A2K1WZ58_POPTR
MVFCRSAGSDHLCSFECSFPASSLLTRVYYSNGGESKWIISWMAVAGWSLTALILFPSYFFVDSSPTPPTFKLLVSYIVLGSLSAADNLMYAYAYAYLPASIAALLASSSLIGMIMSASVILLHDPVKGFKVLPRIITSWGFSSYTSMEIPLLVLKIPNHDLLASSHRIFFLFCSCYIAVIHNYVTFLHYMV